MLKMNLSKIHDIKSRIQSALPFDLRLVLIFILLSIIFVLVPPFNQTPIRIPLALPLLLFIPGYSLVSLLFPKKEDLTGIERLTLSIVLSIAIVIFDGFALNYTPWGVRPVPIVISLSIITLLLLLITVVLRKGIPADERFLFDYHIFLKSLKSDEKTTEIEKALIAALVVSIIIASGIVIYEKLTFPEEKFTAFYILSEGGKAGNYTTDLYLGEPTSIIVGIENHEHAMVNYTLKVKLDRSIIVDRKITIEEGMTWMDNVSLTVNRIGPRMKLSFELYKEGLSAPYRSLWLWVASYIDYEHPEIIEKYKLSHIPRVNNSDMELKTDWVFVGSNQYFRGFFFNPTIQTLENSMIMGYVTDAVTSLPIEDAHVMVSNHCGYVNRTTTNETGYYEMKVIEDHFWLDAWVNDYKKNVTEFDVKDGEALTINMTLKRLGGSVVKGYVFDDATNLPLAYTHVRVSNKSGHGSYAMSNGIGYYKMRISADRYWLHAWKDGYRDINTEFIVTDEQELIINMILERLSIDETTTIMKSEKLPPGIYIVKGHIIDDIKGMPIPNADVVISGYGFKERVKTNESGYFEMKSPSGSLQISAKSDGYMGNMATFTVKDGIAIDLKLTPERAIINGYIYDESGNSIANAEIRVGDNPKQYKQIYYKTVESDENGYYSLKTISGHFWLDVEKDGYFWNGTEFDIDYGMSRRIDIRLKEMPKINSTIRGHVLYNNTGLSGIKVVVSGHNHYNRFTFTDSDGYYEIETVPGHLWLDVYPDVYTDSMGFDITEGQTLSIDLKLNASPLSNYGISYPYKCRSKPGDYGAIYQNIFSENEGIAVLSFKVKDSYNSELEPRYHFKQVLLNEVVIWEDDIAGDEGWQQVKIPITLERGKNRIMLRVYEKRGVGSFRVNVWWDDVRIKDILEVI